MATTEELEIKIKSDLKATTKESQNLVDNFGFLGVTIGDVKNKFKEMKAIMLTQLKAIGLQAKLAAVSFKMMFGGNMAKGAKNLFRIIRAGIISTGVGAFLVAFGSLAAYLTSTKEGAEALEKGLKTVGAAVKVIVDRIAGLGKIIAKVFTGKLSLNEALQETKENFQGVTEEIKTEVKETIKLVDANQKLRDAQRALNVETAKSVAFIEQQKLIAEDVTKSFAEREEAATKAFAREKELEDKRIKLAQQALNQKKAELDMTNATAEDLDELADLEIELANIKQEAAGRQISLNNFLNGLRKEQKDLKQAEIDEQAAKDKEEADKKKAQAVTEAEELRAIEQENFLMEIEDLKERALKKLELEKEAELERIKDYENFNELKAQIDKKYARAEEALEEKKVEWADMTARQKQNLAKDGLNNMAKIMGEESEAGKAFAIMATTISTFQSAQDSYQSLAKIPVVGPVLGGIAAAAAVAMGIRNIQAITSAQPGKPPSGGGGGGGAPAMPAPQMSSGMFSLDGIGQPEVDPVQAYVVSDDVTQSQDKLATIRRRATI
jgi:hypothetical protein